MFIVDNTVQVVHWVGNFKSDEMTGRIVAFAICLVACFSVACAMCNDTVIQGFA